MYAIVDISGKQFKVEANHYVYTPELEGEAGTAVTFDRVLLVDSGSGVTVGTPTVGGATITGKILSHQKAGKELVFKKKRRKGYAKKTGHRQGYTKVLIEAISVK